MAAIKIPITTTITFLIDYHYEKMRTANSVASLYLSTWAKILQVVKVGRGK